MRRAAIITLHVTLFAVAAAGLAEAGANRRAYFRAETPDARARVAPFMVRELPGGIVSAEIPPALLPTLSAAPGLHFIGFEAVYRPAPIATEELSAGAARVPSAGDPVRPCRLPSWIPPVGWGIKTMYADSDLARPSGGAGVRVGVLDTGVFPHLDLERRLVKCVDVTPFPLPVACSDSINHGTLVASVIAADGGADGLGMYGMAPEASIYSYRACDSNDECWGAYVAAGIYAAIADGVNILNLSLVGPGHDPVVLAAIDSAAAHNMLIVAAAGNSPPYSFIGYPGVYPEVMSVGAIKENLAPWPYSAPGLNDGDYIREDKEIDVAAPGAAVLAAMRTGCWVLASGTSLASPMVVGLAAKLWNGNAAATRTKLQAVARLHDLHVPGDDDLTGFGLPTATPIAFVNATGGTGGRLIPSGMISVAEGGDQTIAIVPDGCYTIADVKVDGVSQGPITSYTFTAVTSDHTVQATFSFRGTPVTITASAGTGGTITPAGVASVPCGASRTYTIATAGACYVIQNVIVDGASKGPITAWTFTNITANHTIEATFRALSETPGPFRIQASAGFGGTISPSGTTIVGCRENRTYTIISTSACYVVETVRVDGVPVGSVSTYTFTNVLADHTIEATFRALGPSPGPFVIQSAAGPGGTISPGGSSSTPCGANRTYFIAASDACHVIENVKVDGASLGPVSTYTFTNVRADHTIQATFATLGPYTLNASAGSNGTISPSGALSIPCGASQTFTFTPAVGCYGVQNVKVDGVTQGAVPSYTFSNVRGNHTIQVTFVPMGPFYITAAGSAGGRITPNGVTSVGCGGSMSYSIFPSTICHRILDVKVDNVSRGPISSYTFSNVSASHTLTASFATISSLVIQSSAGPGGTINPEGFTTLACGAGRTYTIEPADECQVIQDVMVDGVSQGPITSYTFTTVTANHSIVATFSPRTFTIHAGAGPGGTISPAGAAAVGCADGLTYTIAPADKCHVIQDVKVDGVSQGPITSHAFAGVMSDHSIQATFATLGPFTIAASADMGAAISPGGTSSVPCGESRSYTIAPADACRRIEDVTVDGASVGPVTGYTFSDVQGNHTIIAGSGSSSLALAEAHTGADWSGIANGAVDLTVTGGVPPYAIAWSNGATSEDLTGLAAGTYEVVVTDAQGCSNRLSATIENLGPAEMALTRPAPNPTSGPLRFRYGIPAPATVRLSVLDLQGREVAVLSEGSQPAGWSWAGWNGETGSGRAPGGVYFIRLRAGGRQIVQRFALVR